MENNKVPNIQPIKLRDFDCKQSKYDMVPKLPMRSIILGPSGSGKTIRHLPKLFLTCLYLQS